MGGIFLDALRSTSLPFDLLKIIKHSTKYMVTDRLLSFDHNGVGCDISGRVLYFTRLTDYIVNV